MNEFYGDDEFLRQQNIDRLESQYQYLEQLLTDFREELNRGR